MSKDPSTSQHHLKPLLDLPVVAASQFRHWASGEDSTPSSAGPFAEERDYRFCRVIAQNPLQPSSAYPSLAGVSPKDAAGIRNRLLERGFIRVRRQDTGRRGRTSLLLEMTPAGHNVLKEFESQEKA